MWADQTTLPLLTLTYNFWATCGPIKTRRPFVHRIMSSGPQVHVCARCVCELGCCVVGVCLVGCPFLPLTLTPLALLVQSYLDSTLIPLVTALKGEPGVGAWEIMNEPGTCGSEACGDKSRLSLTGALFPSRAAHLLTRALLPSRAALIYLVPSPCSPPIHQPSLTLASLAEGSFDMTAEADSAEPCFNPTKAYDGGWTGNDIRIWDMARFVAKQIQAIHEIDPEVLVTLGSANPAMIRSDTIYNNFWSDECMSKALGLETIERFVDFYQVHVYPDGDGHMGVWESFSPFFGPGAPKADWKLDKPLVIGEFPQGKVVGQTGQTPTQEFEFALLGGFDGAWGWCMCTEDNGGCTTEDNAGNLGMEVIGSGLARVLELAEEKVRIKVGGAKPEPDQCGDVPPTPPYVPQEPADCTDLMPPEEGGSCADLKMAGGCKEEGTRGYCCTTCFGCSGVLQCGGI